MQPENLAGLCLGDAFRKYVLQDHEVAEVGHRLIEKQRGYSAVFVDGQAPGPFIDFHWPIRATAESIAFQFVRPLVFFMDGDFPAPSELETEASRALAKRRDILADSF